MAPLCQLSWPKSSPAFPSSSLWENPHWPIIDSALPAPLALNTVKRPVIYRQPERANEHTLPHPSLPRPPSPFLISPVPPSLSLLCCDASARLVNLTFSTISACVWPPVCRPGHLTVNVQAHSYAAGLLMPAQCSRTQTHTPLTLAQPDTQIQSTHMKDQMYCTPSTPLHCP